MRSAIFILCLSAGICITWLAFALIEDWMAAWKAELPYMGDV